MSFHQDLMWLLFLEVWKQVKNGVASEKSEWKSKGKLNLGDFCEEFLFKSFASNFEIFKVLVSIFAQIFSASFMSYYSSVLLKIQFRNCKFQFQLLNFLVSVSNSVLCQKFAFHIQFLNFSVSYSALLSLT